MAIVDSSSAEIDSPALGYGYRAPFGRPADGHEDYRARSDSNAVTDERGG